MKFHKKNLIIILLIIGLVGVIVYKLTNNSMDERPQNGFTKKLDIELNSLDKGDE